MSTFSAAIAIALARGNVTVNSGSGAFTANQVIYTAPASRKTIFELAGAVAMTVGGGFNCNLAYQKKSNYTGNYGTIFSFTAVRGSGAINVFTPIYFSGADRKIMAQYGRIFDHYYNEATPALDGNDRLIMLPDDRIIVTGGTCSEGANFQFEYNVEQYFSTN